MRMALSIAAKQFSAVSADVHIDQKEETGDKAKDFLPQTCHGSDGELI